jgi:hydroxypyruvate isomerase
VTIRPDVNLSILFTELPLLQRPAAAAACGFVAVEFWWPFHESVPKGEQLRDLAEALEAASVSLVGLNFDAGDMAAGDRGLVSLPGEEKRLRENIEVAIEFAEPLGCRAFNALYGNRLEGADPLAQDELAIENLSYAATAAQRIGGMVLIETQNTADSPRYPLTRAAEAVDVIERVELASGASNVKLLADLYHLHRMGEDLAGTVTTFADRIGHVQIAGSSAGPPDHAGARARCARPWTGWPRPTQSRSPWCIPVARASPGATADPGGTAGAVRRTGSRSPPSRP